jgi:hypothetical protein
MVSRRSCTVAVAGEVVLGSVFVIEAVLEASLACSQKGCSGNMKAVSGQRRIRIQRILHISGVFPGAFSTDQALPKDSQAVASLA